MFVGGQGGGAEFRARVVEVEKNRGQHRMRSEEEEEKKNLVLSLSRARNLLFAASFHSVSINQEINTDLTRSINIRIAGFDARDAKEEEEK